MISVSGSTHFRVASPGLREVQAKACPRLQEVAIESHQLQRLDVSHCTQLQRLRLLALDLHQEQLQQQGVVLPYITSLYAERLLSQEVQQQLRSLKAAKRAIAAEARAADRRADV